MSDFTLSPPILAAILCKAPPLLIIIAQSFMTREVRVFTGEIIAGKLYYGFYSARRSSQCLSQSKKFFDCSNLNKKYNMKTGYDKHRKQWGILDTLTSTIELLNHETAPCSLYKVLDQCRRAKKAGEQWKSQKKKGGLGVEVRRACKQLFKSFNPPRQLPEKNPFVVSKWRVKC